MQNSFLKYPHILCPISFILLKVVYIYSCQTSSTQNVIIQNAVPKCKGSINAIILLLYHVVGFVLIADCSKKTISRTESYPSPCEICQQNAAIAFCISLSPKKIELFLFAEDLGLLRFPIFTDLDAIPTPPLITFSLPAWSECYGYFHQISDIVFFHTPQCFHDFNF